MFTGLVSRPVAQEALGERSAEAKVRARQHLCTLVCARFSVRPEGTETREPTAVAAGGSQAPQVPALPPALFPPSLFKLKLTCC